MGKLFCDATFGGQKFSARVLLSIRLGIFPLTLEIGPSTYLGTLRYPQTFKSCKASTPNKGDHMTTNRMLLNTRFSDGEKRCAIALVMSDILFLLDPAPILVTASSLRSPTSEVYLSGVEHVDLLAQLQIERALTTSWHKAY